MTEWMTSVRQIGSWTNRGHTTWGRQSSVLYHWTRGTPFPFMQLRQTSILVEGQTSKKFYPSTPYTQTKLFICWDITRFNSTLYCQLSLGEPVDIGSETKMTILDKIISMKIRIISDWIFSWVEWTGKYHWSRTWLGTKQTINMHLTHPHPPVAHICVRELGHYWLG